MTEDYEERIEYGYVSHECILRIFGSELTYNELKPYTINLDDCVDLIVETLSHPESDWQLIRVFFDGKEMMDKKYVKHHSCDMFDFLSELEDNKYDEQEETDGEDNIE